MLRGRISTSVAWADKSGVDDSMERYVPLGGVMVPDRVRITLDGVLGDPDCAIIYEASDGEARCVSFTVTAKPKGRGLRTSDVQMLNLDAIGEGAFLDYAFTPEGELGDETDDRESWALKSAIGNALRSPRGATLAELEAVARVHTVNPSRPTAAVEEAMGYSRSTAIRRIKLRREKGLL